MPYSIGETILNNKYRIEKLLGQGAFGAVYLATHLRLNVPRALKVIRHGEAGVGSTVFEETRQRFEQESRLGARLNHPNIIQVHDLDEDNGTLVLAMEYALGGSLLERLKEAGKTGSPLPVEQVIQIGLDVAKGLAVMHAMDAIHRDLKPSNILFDKAGQAKVADLGLAQIPHGASERSQKGSMVERHPGTPAYMSPEQENTTGHLKPPSDVYSLGVVLFELLTLRNYKNLEPGTQAHDLREDIPAWLNDLLGSMLAKDPEARPWDGKKLAALLAASEQAIRKAEAARVEAEALAKQAKELREKKERQEAEQRARTEQARQEALAREQGEKAKREDAELRARQENARLAAEQAEAEERRQEMEARVRRERDEQARRPAEALRVIPASSPSQPPPQPVPNRTVPWKQKLIVAAVSVASVLILFAAFLRILQQAPATPPPAAPAGPSAPPPPAGSPSSPRPRTRAWPPRPTGTRPPAAGPPPRWPRPTPWPTWRP